VDLALDLGEAFLEGGVGSGLVALGELSEQRPAGDAPAALLWLIQVRPFAR